MEKQCDRLEVKLCMDALVLKAKVWGFLAHAKLPQRLVGRGTKNIAEFGSTCVGRPSARREPVT